MAQDEMVKVHRPNKPDETRYFTKTAWDYIKSGSKWVEAEDQGQPVAAKKKVVAPVVSIQDVEDKKAKLRAEYKELTGNESEPVWNEARLFIEIEKFKKQPVQTQPEVDKVAKQEPEAQKEKRKYTKRQPA